jgi:hypothetical protein
MVLSNMMALKVVPEGLKSVERESGIGGKNSPVHYIPKQDSIQDALRPRPRPSTSG